MQDLIINENSIKDKIYTIRNMQVMLDRDLAELYGVETKRINEAVKNNKDKFMDDFYFELNDFEFEFLRSLLNFLLCLSSSFKALWSENMQGIIPVFWYWLGPDL